MATLNVQQVSLPSTLATYAAAAAGGDQVLLGDGREVLHIKNDHSSAQTVTVASQRSAAAGYAAANNAVSVAAGAERFIPLGPKRAFADDNGFAQLTYSGVTALTVAVVRL